MTNNEHNESILSAISKKMAEIEELKSQLKPADEVPHADLATCNAGAVEARMARFSQQNAVKVAMSAVMANAMKESEPEPEPEPENDTGNEPEEKPKKAVKNESAKNKAD